jgi:hypothetical protein
METPMIETPWKLALDGVEYTLAPSTKALMAIEALTGRTIHALVEHMKADTPSIQELAIIATALIGAGDPDGKASATLHEHMQTFQMMQMHGFRGQPGAWDFLADKIVARGMITAAGAILTPLVFALNGQCKPDGSVIPEASAILEQLATGESDPPAPAKRRTRSKAVAKA